MNNKEDLKKASNCFKCYINIRNYYSYNIKF